jgi:hypothetical protein
MENSLNSLHDKIKVKLKSFGYLGNDICDARYFVESKIGEYWVDTPPKYRDELAKEYAKKCCELQKIKKEITLFATSHNFKLIYNTNLGKYVVK